MQKRSEIEAMPISGEKKSRDDQHRQIHGMSLGSEVNMTNCYNHSLHFFEKCKGIYRDMLIGYWMMAGYLGHCSSFQEAYNKGNDIIQDMTSKKGNLLKNREGLLIFSGSSSAADVKDPTIKCKHQGFCVNENLGFIDLLGSDLMQRSRTHHNYLDLLRQLAEYFRKYSSGVDGQTRMISSNAMPLSYLVDFEPTPKSVINMLARREREARDPHLRVLLIRGCVFWSPAFFPDPTKFNSLTILEISSSRCSPRDLGIISELASLECLNLSHLPHLEMLPDNLFYKLRQLRWLIVRGCSNLRSFPSIDGLTRLEVLDLSQSLKQTVFLDIRYPQLRILHLSYNPLVYGFRELSTPNLTCLSIRGSKLKQVFLSNKPTNLHVPPELPSLRELDLSDCEHLVSLFPLMNAPRLEHLNLSGCTSFTQLDEDLLHQMPCLVSLDLSWTKVNHLPSFSSLTSLRILSIRGLELDSIDTFASLSRRLVELDLAGLKISSSQELELDFLPSLEDLRVLNLSHTSVAKLPDMSKLVSLKKLLLADCQQLKVLPDFKAHVNLVELDLTGLNIHSTEELNVDFLPSLENLRVLNLSHTSVAKLPDMSKLVSLKKLLLADCHQLKVLPDFKALVNLEELDLTGLKIPSTEELNVDFLPSLKELRVLNLSQTSVAKLPDMSKLVSLKKLLLADCQQLKLVPDLSDLKRLETLDLSLPDDSAIDIRQLESDTSGGSFPLPKSLRKLVLTNRSGIQKLFPSSALKSLEFIDLRGTDVEDWDGELKPPKPAEVHVVYSDKSHQPLDRFKEVFINLDALISDIQKKSDSSTTSDPNHKAFKMQLESLRNDWRYIQENIDALKSREEILLELMDAATNLSATDFAFDSAAFNQICRMVVNSKLQIPRKQKDNSESLDITKRVTKKNNKSSLVRSKNKEDIDPAELLEDMSSGSVSSLVTSYESLSDVQKKCLLCFSAFPYYEDNEMNTCVVKSIVIKTKMLIYWWVGEGFIGTETAAGNREEANEQSFSTMGEKKPKSVEEIGKQMAVSTRTAAGNREEVNEQGFSTKELKKPKSFEEIGKEILDVLVAEAFIEPVMKKGRKSKSYSMHPIVRYFVIQRAKEDGFFAFNQESCKLSPHFGRSRRACFLKQQNKSPSSSELWARHVDSPKKLASFETVTTLFNVNDTMIDIKREWFSKMKNLHVLHLGDWRSEKTDLIEVEDQRFLEDLKRMKQLRLLSLQGLPTIMKLPDSVCQLSNLIILDLKECSYLEELPADIGSLKSLTHLDITSCTLLYEFPKGISLLSNLEVLKGFVITSQHVARSSQDRNKSTISRWWEKTKKCSRIQGLFPPKKNKACTFRDLLKLERLRELSLTVNISTFPDDEELKIFKEMKQLCKLKILWEKNVHIEDKGASTEQQALKECQHTEERRHLGNIEKLEMWCLPHENAPEWLNPSGLKNLKKLYIVGGNLTKLPGSHENPWNVETLRLKHLHKLDIQWPALKDMFPQLMYLEKHQCPSLVRFPCDWEGVWKPTS